MDTNTRAQIILAAITAAGTPGEGEDGTADYQNRIMENAAMFTSMLDENSSISKVIGGVERSKVFTATILGIKKEQSSTRGKVILKTKPSKFHEDGVEEARTERTDTRLGLAMAQKLRSLIGHRVAIWVEVEEINGGQGKVRVVRHVEDMGVDSRYQLDAQGTLVEVSGQGNAA